jgi:hypothetical protein
MQKHIKRLVILMLAALLAFSTASSIEAGPAGGGSGCPGEGCSTP